MSTNLPYTTTYNIEGLTNGNTTIEFTSGETTNYLSKKKTIDIVSSVEGSSSGVEPTFSYSGRLKTEFFLIKIEGSPPANHLIKDTHYIFTCDISGLGNDSPSVVDVRGSLDNHSTIDINFSNYNEYFDISLSNVDNLLKVDLLSKIDFYLDFSDSYFDITFYIK